MKSGTWTIERNSLDKMQRYEIPTFITIAFMLINSSSKWILLICLILVMYTIFWS